MFVNSTETTINNVNLDKRIHTNHFDDVIGNIATYIDKVYKIYEENQYNNEILSNQKKYMVIIYGVYDFINKLSADSKMKLSEMMKKDNQIGIVSFVFVDNPDVIKSYAYEEWFKNGCDTSRGIWIGSGITEQSLFKISRFEREDREEITNEYGYIIQSSKIAKIKLLSTFDVKE
jgi:hypothetical protein